MIPALLPPLLSGRGKPRASGDDPVTKDTEVWG